MPRSNRRRDDDIEPVRLDAGSIVQSPPGWIARSVQPINATKRYRCPFCEREVAPGTAHVVAWPLDDESQRRHFHAACWRAATSSGRRIPT